MSDIFIGYTRSDRVKVQILAKACEHVGWPVWWDPPHSRTKHKAPDGVWLDPETKLMWTINDNGKDINWLALLPGGRFDATPDALPYLAYTQPGTFNSFRVDELLKEFHDPEAVQAALSKYCAVLPCSR